MCPYAGRNPYSAEVFSRISLMSTSGVDYYVDFKFPRAASISLQVFKSLSLEIRFRPNFEKRYRDIIFFSIIFSLFIEHFPYGAAGMNEGELFEGVACFNYQRANRRRIRDGGYKLAVAISLRLCFPFYFQGITIVGVLASGESGFS